MCEQINKRNNNKCKGVLPNTPFFYIFAFGNINIFTMRRLIISLILTLTLLISCLNKKSNQPETINLTRFETLTKNQLPIIDVEINGERYDFLIASGATISLVDSSVCANRKLTIVDADHTEKIITLGGVFTKSKHVNLMNQTFYVHDIHKLVSEVKDYTGVKVDGIIGYDILQNNKSTIDFEKQIISNIKNN